MASYVNTVRINILSNLILLFNRFLHRNSGKVNNLTNFAAEVNVLTLQSSFKIQCSASLPILVFLVCRFRIYIMALSKCKFQRLQHGKKL